MVPQRRAWTRAEAVVAANNPANSALVESAPGVEAVHVGEHAVGAAVGDLSLAPCSLGIALALLGTFFLALSGAGPDGPLKRFARRPGARLGPISVTTAVNEAVALFGNRFRMNELISILVGASLMSFLGLWDDRRGLSPWLKLIGQFLAASILVYSYDFPDALELPALLIGLGLAEEYALGATTLEDVYIRLTGDVEAAGREAAG